MMTVHSVTRGWQDICVLLGLMGYMQPPIPCLMEGCPVTSSIHVVPSFIKNLPQKARPLPQDCTTAYAASCLRGMLLSVHRSPTVDTPLESSRRIWASALSLLEDLCLCYGGIPTRLSIVLCVLHADHTYAAVRGKKCAIYAGFINAMPHLHL